MITSAVINPNLIHQNKWEKSTFISSEICDFYWPKYYHNLMKNQEYFSLYHNYFDQLISEYDESGYFMEFINRTKRMIAPYVKKDPTAFCSYEDFLLGLDTITQFCLLRAESVRGQLEGRIPATIAEQRKSQSGLVDASSISLPDMGEIVNLRNDCK